MRELRVVENQVAVLDLTAEDAAALRAMGRRMASAMTWWGKGAETATGSVIDVAMEAPDRYHAIFRDVVGVVRLAGCQIEVAPKIPPSHFLYLAARGAVGPRIDLGDVSVAPSTHLADVLAAWFMRAAEKLLNVGLRPDYRTYQDRQTEVRGEILPCETVMEMMQGRPVAHCRYDELSDDAPMNRVVKAACTQLARHPAIPEPLRARARRTAFRFHGVGPLQPQDVRVHVDRVNRSYARVFPLALLVLRGLGVSTLVGPNRGSAFLFRTPELIETGLREVIQDAFPGIEVAKRRFQLGDTGLSMNPDLVFGDNEAVGDVKYRLFKKDWHRTDLNQAVAFAAVARCRKALIVGFAADASTRLPRTVPVGDIAASCIAWIAHDGVGIEENVYRLSAALREWREGPMQGIRVGALASIASAPRSMAKSATAMSNANLLP